jgi:methionyl-tRNA formyltransferase
MNKPRVVVFGYSEVGYVCLECLLQREVNVVAVFSHQDDPGENHWFRSVPQLAQAHGLPLFTPESLKAPVWEQRLREELRPDLIFSFYYRRLIPMRLLDLAPLGAFNMHGSLLPKYRGKAPVNWAVLNGEDHGGATLHHMVAKPDAGDVVDQERVPIGERDPAAVVMRRVVAAARQVLERRLEQLLAGTAPREPQAAAAATYFGGRTPEDGRIDWRWPARRSFNLVRAVTRPYPGAFADFPDGRRLIVWWAEPEPAEPGAPPGTILSNQPLRIAAGDGILTVTDYEWQAAPG